jgi:hypothetical protein
VGLTIQVCSLSRQLATPFKVCCSCLESPHWLCLSAILLPTNTQQGGEIAHSFEDYLKALPDWDKSLFNGLIMENSCYNIPALLLHLTQLPTTASRHTHYSSATVQQAMVPSFGWALSMLGGRILARCSGPAPGHKFSFQLEGYGMLAAVRFLHYLLIFCQCIFVGPYRFVTDNQGLITRVQDRLTYVKPYPNSTLDPDWVCK